MRTLLIAVAFLAFLPAMSACDVCGCSIGGNYFGILPQFHRHFVGFRYLNQSFQSAHNWRAAEQGNFNSDEHFQTADILARFYPLRRLQMLVLLPYHDFQRTESGVKIHTQGLGDASLMANFLLIDTGDSLRRSWKHTLSIGGGLKLPTGRHNLKDNEGEVLLENLQPGTGSTDFMLSAAYTLRKGYWGITGDVLGRFNTANRNDYRYGHRVSGSAKVFYWKKAGKISFLPNLGVFADYAGSSTDAGKTVSNTGGGIMLGTLGLDVYAGHVSFGFTFQPPLIQALGGSTIHANNRWMATANYIF